MTRGFQFPFQSVLRVKTQQQQQAELKLGRLRSRLAYLRTELKALESQFIDVTDHLANSVDNTLGSEFNPAHQHFIDRLRKTINSAKQNLADTKCEYDESLSHRNIAAKEVEALLTLRATKLRGYQENQNRRSLEKIDEHVLRSWTATSIHGEDER
jgi:flagellar export protein FliJ